MSIASYPLVGLYIGRDFADIKGEPGASAARSPAPPELKGDINALRQLCDDHFAQFREGKFMVDHESVMYRVTVLDPVDNERIFVLRRPAAKLRDIGEINLPNSIEQALLAPETRGLVLVVGEMEAGKTSTAGSIFVSRLRAIGGVSMAIDNPPELRLHGVHGNGRCIQIWAHDETGGFGPHIEQAMLSGLDSIFLSEIKKPAEAAECLLAAVNGHFILATMHAGSLTEAIQRLYSLALTSKLGKQASELLADGLAIIIHQRLVKTGKLPGAARMAVTAQLSFLGDEGLPRRKKVRDGAVDQLVHDIETDRTRAFYE